MDIHHLRYFCAVADAGTFAAAAAALSMSASPLSRRVRDLEVFMGTPLFVRGGRALRLTDDGLRLLAAARAVLDAYAEVEAQRAPAFKTAPLRIGLVPGVSLALTSALERALSELRPLADVEYVPAISSIQNAKVLNDELDFATVRRVDQDARLDSMVVAVDELVLLASPSSVRELHSPLLPAELKDWTMLSAYTVHFSDDLDALFVDQKIDKFRMVPRADARALGVLAQHGRTFLTGLASDVEGLAGFLEVIETGRPIMAETRLVWRRDRRDLKEIISAVSEQLQRE